MSQLLVVMQNRYVGADVGVNLIRVAKLTYCYTKRLLFL